MKDEKVLVIFSGGQDSTTCLGYAVKKYGVRNVACISFNYGQQHSIELEQAKKICTILQISDHRIIDISFFGGLVDSALTKKDGDVAVGHSRLKDLPASFVPCRNQMFITIAHAYAQTIGAKVLFTGTCQTDYSGYPDCRDNYIKGLQAITNFGYQTDILIETPLMFLTKAETFKLAKDCGVLDLVVEHSHTCYKGNRTLKHNWGYGCGECPACLLRKQGWEKYLMAEDKNLWV